MSPYGVNRPQWVKVTSYERLKVPNQRRIDFVFNSLFTLETKEISKTWHHWPFVRKSIGDRWIPLKKDQYCGKRKASLYFAAIMRKCLRIGREWIGLAYHCTWSLVPVRWLVMARWRIYASMNWVVTDSGTGLSFMRCQPAPMLVYSQ